MASILYVKKISVVSITTQSKKISLTWKLIFWVEENVLEHFWNLLNMSLNSFDLCFMS